MSDRPPVDPKAHDPQALDADALASMSVTPPDPAKPDPESESAETDRADACDPRQKAGQDESLAERLARDPACENAKLDVALDESMDASDPPSQTRPGGDTDPAPSSGYDAHEEALRRK